MRGDRVVVATDQVTRGQTRIVERGTVLDWQAIGEWRTAHPGRDLPTDFCNPLPS